MIKFTHQLAQTSPSASQIQITPQDVNLSNPATADSNTLQTGLGLVYFVAGVLCVVIIIIGGVRYTISRGDSGNVQSAKNTIIYALVGLLVVLMAAAITQLIFDRL